MRERDVERYFIKRVKEAGGLQRKFKSPGFSGVPDRICGFPGGRFAFVEMKRPGAKAQLGQLREHHRWKKLGFLVFVVDTKEGVDVFIDFMLR